ncbi:F-type conjugative transfer protein TrbC [Klebsiella pneumoniae]|uniref:F-type conjugative transfer protein TrbC n=1 Tax=Klebsiella pneumoniae TaxID=573 RepID=UPI0027E0AFA3|nr:F-type conjugative transfer protein TrbC [Klebsiella pneumoniae]MDQ6369717.1 TraG/TraD/VirD4 family protein [Klebsiella pneumoniae]
MQQKQKPVDAARLQRQVHQSMVEEMAYRTGPLLLAIIAIFGAAIVWPVLLWAAIPVMLVWVPMFMLNEFRMPARMPMDMDRLDPSTETMRPGKLLGFLPVTKLNRHMEKAAGVFYTGYERTLDGGREIWLRMDDLTRHLILMATTGAGKTEMLLGFVLNALCWAKGLIFSDGKAQNDVWFAVASLSRRFGREDDLRLLNYITGGQSRSQRLLENDKSRQQSNNTNPFALAQETYITQLMDSMMPDAGNDRTWQEKAKGMNQVLTKALIYKSRKEQKVMSQRLIQEYLSLDKFAELYLQAEAEEWHEEIRTGLRNYLSTSVPGFDMSLITKPSEWSQEARNQHGYLTSQYNRMLSLFSDTYGHVFSSGAGDIDLRDVVHNDRILVILIPALELSASEALTLGRLTTSQLAMILSQDLGERMEGKAEDILVIKKFRDRFPFLWLADEVGSYYSDTIGQLATQVRSLGYALVLAGQDLQKLKTAVGDKLWTLLGNMFTRIFGTIIDPTETAEFAAKSAGMEYQAIQDSMEYRAGAIGGSYADTGRVTVQEKPKLPFDELQALNQGEQATVFKGAVIRNNALYIADDDKITDKDVRINRFVEVEWPTYDSLSHLLPAKVRRDRPRPASINRIMAIVKNDKIRHAPDSMIIQDGVLYAIADEAMYFDEVAPTPPNTVQRATQLLSLAAAVLTETRGRYRVEYPEPEKLSVKKDELEKYQHIHQSAVTQQADGFSY